DYYCYSTDTTGIYGLF
nr:immunoglobulin light chain junction region [Macaca mulatta]MOW58213.1 immunoglobulin light chain junction region [Macaca mulatta]MOW58821.1 immunoglobulin light chain junction region [Macaca mulatta]MOW58830.1 immunoglobulin light chain junction region [Macaca mulatta]MOW58848.1 immunoglobulin light chain junction region [Macaca mulatta]